MEIKRNIFYFISIGFILGIFVSSYLKISIYFLFFFFMLFSLLLIFFVSKSYFKKDVLRYSVPILIIVGCLSFCLGFFRFEFSENILANNSLSSFEGKNVSVIGIVAEEPARKENLFSFRAEISAVALGGETKVISPSYILLKLPSYQNISYGDKIVVSGKIEKIKNFKSNDGNFFDYVSYLKKDNVLFEVKYPQVEIVSSGNGNFIIRALLDLKQKFIDNISQNLGEPDASLVSGMSVSGKGAIDKTLQDDFVKAGIIHIVVLSGYNISIVVVVLLSIFSFARRKIKMIIVFIGVVFFFLISGGTSTVLRAAIMAIVALFAKFSGRKSSSGRVLLLTAFIMIFWNPYILAFDPSFQLSFLATFAVIFIAPIVKEKTVFITEKYNLRAIVSETLGTQIFLLPFLIYKIGIVSFVALPVNILVLPTVPTLMFFGFIIGAIGFVPYIVFPFSFICHILISFILLVVKVFISIPFATISISSFPVVAVFFIYAIFGIYLLHSRHIVKAI